MNIKNYTSSVPVERSIAVIESKLAASGASQITKLYDPKGRVTAIVFKFTLQNSRSYSFRLPARPQACFDAIWKEKCLHSKPRPETKNTVLEQAHRTSWKLIQDWIDIQISLIVLQQVEFLEVFLPFAWDASKQQTLFESFKSGGFKQLTDADGKE